MLEYCGIFMPQRSPFKSITDHIYLSCKYSMRNHLLVLLFLTLLITAISASAQEHLTSESHLLSASSADEAHLWGGSRYGGRGSSSVGSWWFGFVAGPLLFFCSFICIWYNQKRAAIDERRLKLARQIVEDVDVTSQSSAMSKDGHLVYANGETRTTNVIGDRLSGINGPNLIKITRSVEVLEWRRHTRRENDRDIEYYELEWVSTNSPSEGHYHNDPNNWFVSSEVIYNEQVYLGGYNVSKEVEDLCNKTVHFPLSPEHAQNVLRNTGRMDRMPSAMGDYLQFAPSGGMGQGHGTLRIRYSLCPTGPMSLVGESHGATFKPFPIARYEGTEDQRNDVPACCCCCISACYAELLKPLEYILEVHEQYLNKDEIFEKAIEKSKCFTLVMRILSFVCMVLGIYLFFSPITILLGYIPLVGGFLKGVVGFIIVVAAVIICIPLWILMSAIAWLVWHPKIGFILLAIGGVILALVLILGRGGSEQGGEASHMQALHQAALTLRQTL